MTVSYFTATTTGTRPVGVRLSASATNNGAVGRGLPPSIPSDQLFFWTHTWQEGEAESAAAREAGRAHEFANGRDAIRWLLRADGDDE